MKMKTKTKYSSSEAAAVMNLLRHRLDADRQIQKADRAQLRRRGFWISDFWTGFSDVDFRRKVKDGTFTLS